MEDRHFIRYLELLGLRTQPPSLPFLQHIVRKQLTRIPFENLSKLKYWERYGDGQLIPMEAYLDGIEKYHFGGTCYAINYYLNQLLKWLDFEVKLCGAAMQDPDVHLVTIVRIDQGEFLVDAGYAAPFSEPLPTDQPHEHSIRSGKDSYVLQPRGEDGISRMDHYRNGVLTHGYRINPLPRSIEEFRKAIEDSFMQESTFMNELLLTRMEEDHFIRIHNRTLTLARGPVSEEQELDSPGHLASAIHTHFHIPVKLCLECIQGLRLFEE